MERRWPTRRCRRCPPARSWRRTAAWLPKSFARTTCRNGTADWPRRGPGNTATTCWFSIAGKVKARLDKHLLRPRLRQTLHGRVVDALAARFGHDFSPDPQLDGKLDLAI